MRFLLGAAEAGFFPGLIVYLSHWFRYEDRAKAVAWFMAAIPISNLVGSPISGLLLGVHWLDRPGWRWLFIVEGVPAIILGFVTILMRGDDPRFDSLRNGDYVSLSGDWVRGYFQAYRVDNIDDGNYRR